MLSTSCPYGAISRAPKRRTTTFGMASFTAMLHWVITVVTGINFFQFYCQINDCFPVSANGPAC
jgi:hypothetical protein